MSQEQRFLDLTHWIQKLGYCADSISPASSDASFRRYYRIEDEKNHRSLIVMDAPSQHEKIEPFIDITHRLEKTGVNVPKIIAQDLEQGFLLLTDLGIPTYYDVVTNGADDRLIQTIYRQAVEAMAEMQKADTKGLPVYDKTHLMQELDLFNEWYLDKYCQITLSPKEKEALFYAFDYLTNYNDKEPKVFIHRDFHSPNLIFCEDEDRYGPNPGIIDYQDGALGPVSYDLASTVMDARTTWDEECQIDWAIRYWKKAEYIGLPVPDNFADFHQNYEYMSLQRNLRILGVFARLSLRDQKHQYLNHMPRVIKYVRQVGSRYHPFKPIVNILDRIENIKQEVKYTF
ncbi:aminoglycoside phosphotransferase family protein [Basilea psittacipulmonis]|uniref:Aminoglycoside phosphotransferase n=1 Tax=Basilea psittacipulmonis DSM 24701 TaxID=1072685 RepID=A0A077DE86_9BURK|nr:phosphotransferase [Basilea psittacipulmonis]AIL33009.1 aminoglycoside phosphotransferase [Basilea psittacipulmonis DSM 24701]